jgi:very-short-patch-repair endonuclease
VNPKHNARRLRRTQTAEEKQLWKALRAGRFAGFKFRRQYPAGKYYLDFYCPMAHLSIELDGFQHGTPGDVRRDAERKQWLEREGILELRFWNRQWRENPDGVLIKIWSELHRATGYVSVERKLENRRFVPPKLEELKNEPLSPTLSPLNRGARENRKSAD